MSVCSYSNDGDDRSWSVAVPDNNPANNQTNVSVDSMVVQPGAFGILHGTQNNVNVTFLLTKDDVDNVRAGELISDALKITSESSKTFTPFDCDKSFKVNGIKDAEELSKQWYYLIIALVVLALVTLLGTAVLSLTSWRFLGDPGGGTNNEPSIPSRSTDEEALIAGTPGAPRIVNMSSWSASPPLGPYSNNILPVKMVVVCHTGTDICATTTDCSARVRSIQNFHQKSLGWVDIGYNFLIGGDGAVYWGRGFENMGVHTKGYNNMTIGVAFIGNFIHQLPNDNQTLAFHQLMDVGVQREKIGQDYILVAQCQLHVTASPGHELATKMMTWDHFNSSLPLHCTSS